MTGNIRRVVTVEGDGGVCSELMGEEAEMGDSFIEISKLSEPLTKLVEVVGQGIGGAYRPLGTVLQAKADAKAKHILAKADIEITDLQKRALERVLHTETVRQENIEAIIDHAGNMLPESVSDDKVDTDWITQFFTLAQDVSDEDMRVL